MRFQLFEIVRVSLKAYECICLFNSLTHVHVFTFLGMKIKNFIFKGNITTFDCENTNVVNWLNIFIIFTALKF